MIIRSNKAATKANKYGTVVKTERALVRGGNRLRVVLAVTGEEPLDVLKTADILVK
jgi:IS4 transposase